MRQSAFTTKQVQDRQAMQVRAIFFNRFLLIRYVTAGFFFMNLYWMILAWGSGSSAPAIVAGILFLGFIGVAIEQAQKLHTQSAKLPIARSVYLFQGLVNVGLIVTILSGKFQWFYGFLAQQAATQFAVLGLLVAGLLFIMGVLWKARRIERNQDRTYKRMKALKETF